MTSINYFSNKVILITGGSGSFGSYATKKLLNLNPKEIRAYSITTEKQKILAKKINNDSKVRFILGNVEDEGKLVESAKGVDIVIHAAANKHIDLCQENPQGASATNVIGTQSVIKAALKNTVNFVVNLSAVKAVSPTSVYGATKYLSEQLLIEAAQNNNKIRFINLRYSNVLGSSGSVVEIFKEKLQKGETVEVFDSRDERLILTQDNVWELLETAINYGKGGETFVFLAPKIKVVEIARTLKKQIGKGQIKLGKRLKEGERIGATISSKEETKRTYQVNDQIATVLPVAIKRPSLARIFRRFKKEFYSVENAPNITVNQLIKILNEI